MAATLHNPSNKCSLIIPSFNTLTKEEEEVKYLGLYLDGRLTWHKHILQNGNNQKSPSSKCHGYSDKSLNFLQATNFSCIKQYSYHSGLTEYNSVVRLPLPT
jgi:hypothetical protein